MSAGGYQPWGEREGWKDVEPVEQEDGVEGYPVVSISYSVEFEDTMNYVRALMKKNEHSLRALEITKDAIGQCPGNYTLWCYRRSVLSSLSSTELYAEEFSFIEEFIQEYPKCYQVWHQCQWLADITGDYSRAIKLCDVAIENDSKNYHAWSYRQRVIAMLNRWEEELCYLDQMLQKDHWNNSVWSMRYFVLKHLKDQATALEREMDMCMHYIEKDVENESPWSYLRALVQEANSEEFRKKWLNVCEQCLHVHPDSVHPRAALVDLHAHCVAHSSSSNILDRVRVVDTCLELAKLDPIRKKYWLYCRQRINSA